MTAGPFPLVPPLTDAQIRELGQLKLRRYAILDELAGRDPDDPKREQLTRELADNTRRRRTIVATFEATP